MKIWKVLSNCPGGWFGGAFLCEEAAFAGYGLGGWDVWKTVCEMTVVGRWNPW